MFFNNHKRQSQPAVVPPPKKTTQELVDESLAEGERFHQKHHELINRMEALAPLIMDFKQCPIGAPERKEWSDLMHESEKLQNDHNRKQLEYKPAWDELKSSIKTSAELHSRQYERALEVAAVQQPIVDKTLDLMQKARQESAPIPGMQRTIEKLQTERDGAAQDIGKVVEITEEISGLLREIQKINQILQEIIGQLLSLSSELKQKVSKINDDYREASQKEELPPARSFAP